MNGLLVAREPNLEYVQAFNQHHINLDTTQYLDNTRQQKYNFIILHPETRDQLIELLHNIDNTKVFVMFYDFDTPLLVYCHKKGVADFIKPEYTPELAVKRIKQAL